jgi:hypothetical protein
MWPRSLGFKIKIPVSTKDREVRRELQGTRLWIWPLCIFAPMMFFGLICCLSLVFSYWRHRICWYTFKPQLRTFCQKVLALEIGGQKWAHVKVLLLMSRDRPPGFFGYMGLLSGVFLECTTWVKRVLCSGLVDFSYPVMFLSQAARKALGWEEWGKERGRS